jgi:Fic family protein
MTTSSDRSRGIDGVDEFSTEPAEDRLGEWAGAHYPEVGPRLALLRCLLEASQGRLNAHEAAYKLGCSTRTLRRTLRELGTTFQAEAQAARRARHAS